MAKITVELDSKVLAKAMRLSKGQTKKQVINAAVLDYAQRLGQKDFIDRLVSGKIKWRFADGAVERFWEERRRGRAESKKAYLARQRPSRKAA